jgi:alpha-tubulin suppressor-like RCC1 family protein
VKVFTDGWLRGRVVTDLAVGNDYVCVLADGRAYCWGMNNFGQTGNRGPGGFNYNAPVPVGGVLSGKTVTKIEAWSLTTCAVADGKAYCWGSNTNGQLGNGDAARANTDYPVAVDTSGVLNGKTVTGVSVGTYSSCAVADGKGYCWGDNMQGQLGASTPQSSSDIPVAVISSGLLSGKTLTYIGIGNYHACALTSDGKVYCWGFATRGEWGTGLNEFRDTNPHATALGTKVITMLGVGDNSSCALDTDGGVYCWGVGSGGKLGNGTTDNALAPTMVNTSGVLSGKTVSKLWVGRNNAFVGY